MKDRNAMVRTGISILCTTVIATAGASWTARSMLASIDQRMTVNETRTDLLTKALTDSMQSLAQDVREIRGVVMAGRNQ